MQTFEYPSSSSDAMYRVVITDEGRLECNCRGWTMKKKDKARDCSHAKRLREERGLNAEEKWGYLYVTPSRRPVVTAAPALALNTYQVEDVSTRGRRIILPPKDEPAAPANVEPMLASPMPDDKIIDDYASDGYVLEEKLDGHRVTVSVSATNEVRAWSRPKTGERALARQLPDFILDVLADFPAGSYDGELIVPGLKSNAVTDGRYAKQRVYVIFDVTQLLGRDLTSTSYEERRAYLAEIFTQRGSEHVKLVRSQPVSKAAVDAIWSRGGEGGIIKRVSSRYRPGARSADWIKVKKLQHKPFTCTGFEAGSNGPHSKVLLVDDDGIETSVKTLNAAERRFIEANPSSFIGRRLVVEYTERIGTSYRHPRFDHWV